MLDVSSTPLPQLPARELDSHKGDFGRLLVIGGSRGMAGAPALAGKAALRSGAGLVTLASPRAIQNIVASLEPSYMTLGLGEAGDDFLLASHAAEILAAAAAMDVIALGPGLGGNDSTARLVQELYQSIHQPMIVDADALNALSKDNRCLEMPGGARILTPHPGEFRRLFGQPCAVEAWQRAEQAAALCGRDPSRQTTVVLKGHQTIITDGLQWCVDESGNPGMATGGTGDCLTGVVSALVAQKLVPWDASRLGVHVHGRAGDLAAEKLGQVSLMASDLVDFLPVAFQQLEG